MRRHAAGSGGNCDERFDARGSRTQKIVFVAGGKTEVQTRGNAQFAGFDDGPFQSDYNVADTAGRAGSKERFFVRIRPAEVVNGGIVRCTDALNGGIGSRR